jgi:iron-sulfur cluster assembly accessory protein
MREKMLTITASAKKYLNYKRIEKEKKYILLNLKPSGCAGFEYDWDYCDGLKITDRLIDDILVVSYEAAMAVSGSTIDYNEELIGSYLTVTNPNVQDACGCGVSFTI